MPTVGLMWPDAPGRLKKTHRPMSLALAFYRHSIRYLHAIILINNKKYDFFDVVEDDVFEQ
jgi:hypothetical protein